MTSDEARKLRRWDRVCDLNGISRPVLQAYSLNHWGSGFVTIGIHYATFSGTGDFHERPVEPSEIFATAEEALCERARRAERRAS